MTGRFQGACLYLPATHPALEAVALGGRVAGLRAAVVCFEDALAEDDVAAGLARLRALPRQRPSQLALYVRPRSVAMLETLLAWDGQSAFAGFVLPKLTAANIDTWLRPLTKTTTHLMPILETVDVFDPFQLRDIVDTLADPTWASRIDAVRLGAVDLFGALGVRRPVGPTIYDTALGPTVRMTAALLIARGLPVTAPVCELIRDNDIARAEVALDDGGAPEPGVVHQRGVSGHANGPRGSAARVARTSGVRRRRPHVRARAAPPLGGGGRRTRRAFWRSCNTSC